MSTLLRLFLGTKKPLSLLDRGHLHGRDGVRREEVHPALRLADHLVDRLPRDSTLTRHARLTTLLDFGEKLPILIRLGNRRQIALAVAFACSTLQGPCGLGLPTDGAVVLI